MGSVSVDLMVDCGFVVDAEEIRVEGKGMLGHVLEGCVVCVHGQSVAGVINGL